MCINFCVIIMLLSYTTFIESTLGKFPIHKTFPVGVHLNYRYFNLIEVLHCNDINMYLNTINSNVSKSMSREDQETFLAFSEIRQKSIMIITTLKTAPDITNTIICDTVLYSHNYYRYTAASHFFKYLFLGPMYYIENVQYHSDCLIVSIEYLADINFKLYIAFVEKQQSTHIMPKNTIVVTPNGHYTEMEPIRFLGLTYNNTFSGVVKYKLDKRMQLF